MRYLFPYLVFVFTLFLQTNTAMAQDTIKKKKALFYSNSIKKSEELRKAYDLGDEESIAKNYESLAEDFYSKKNETKAEEYYQKALLVYRKLKRKEDVARVVRNLAKMQEIQKKFVQASSNYKAASEETSDKNLEIINTNDFIRLNSSNASKQKELLNSNIKLLEKEDKKEELSDAYLKKAETDKLENKSDEAINNYNKALVYAVAEPEKVLSIKNKIADIYVANNEFDKALEINQSILKNSEKKNDFNTQIIQKQKLASLYFQKNEPAKAVEELKAAYALASKKGNTAEVKRSLLSLVDYYKKKGDDKERLLIYSDFLQNFDAIIQSDTTLIDAKIFQVTEEKIKQLETEKALKDELIAKKNTFNFVLIGAVLLLLLFFGIIVKALFSIKKKNKRIALQSLRREMNPHFIFNSLNSVNQFISQNKELEANKYLTNYSQLMRHIMIHSNQDFVSLSNEIEQLKKYLDLEHLRFQDKFDYEIVIEPTLDTDALFVPNMIIQPHIENAIWHGLRYKKEKGKLLLKVAQNSTTIIMTIDDDGIGISQSNALKTEHQKVHQSRGVSNTKERIALLSELYKTPINLNIIQKQLPATGTIVTVEFPIIYKMP
jgi:two-component system, sensor histidine kinase YesM